MDISEIKRPIIGFGGLGHLGICSAFVAAAKGFKVVGIDTDPIRAANLNAGKLPIVEPELSRLVGRGDAYFSSNASHLKNCDIVYIAADVNDESDMKDVDAFFSIATAYARHDAIIVVLSPVPVGWCRTQRHNRTLFYQIETLVYGDAVARALSPDTITIGSSTPNAPLPEAFSLYLRSFRAKIEVMSYESAEMAKMSINCMLMAQIAATNTLAEICANNGADWADVARVLKRDPRIGSYLRPGLGVGGGHFERDIHRARETGSRMALAWLDDSRMRAMWAANLLTNLMPLPPQRPTIAVWGLTYKENTDSTRNSASLRTIDALRATMDFVTHDPTTSQDKPLGTLKDADALAILTPWPHYRETDPAAIARAMRGHVVLDPYRVLDGDKCHAAGLDYYTLGKAPTFR